MSEGAHLNDTEFAGFVDNRLDQATRRRAIAHLDTCNDCRAELIAITSLVRGTPSPSLRPIVSSWRRGRVWALAGAGALAAAIAGILLPGRIRPRRRNGANAHRGFDRVTTHHRPGPARRRLGAEPGGWGVRLACLRFRQLPVRPPRRRTGRPVVPRHARHLTGPPCRHLPPTRWGTYFWRVDAHADGITASSGTMRLQVPR